MHGEIGQTQFLPLNVLKYGADGDGNGRIDMVRSKADALASTANFLRGHGWQKGAGYQPGQPNYSGYSRMECRERLSAGNRHHGCTDRRPITIVGPCRPGAKRRVYPSRTLLKAQESKLQ